MCLLFGHLSEHFQGYVTGHFQGYVTRVISWSVLCNLVGCVPKEFCKSSPAQAKVSSDNYYLFMKFSDSPCCRTHSPGGRVGLDPTSPKTLTSYHPNIPSCCRTNSLGDRAGLDPTSHNTLTF